MLSVAESVNQKCVMLCVIVTLFVQFEKRENTHEGVLLFNKVSEFSQQLYWKYHSSMGVFHIFKITQMVPNCAKRLRCWPIFPLTYLALTHYCENNVDPKCFHTILQCQHFMRHRKRHGKTLDLFFHFTEISFHGLRMDMSRQAQLANACSKYEMRTLEKFVICCV